MVSFLSSVNYVNLHGDAVSTTASPQARKPASPQASYHRGWRVVGYPPGFLANERAAFDSMESEKDSPKEFNLAAFMKNHAKKSIRSTPFGIYDAAQVCKELAEKAGWEFVEIREIKKEAA